MSFTQDELQSFHTVLEQRLQALQRDIENAFDQRLSEYRRDSEHRMYAMQHELLRAITFKLTEFQEALATILDQKLARQMQSIEKLLSQQTQQAALASLDQLNEEASTNGHQHLDTIEVQTELPWEDLADVIGQTLDERLQSLKEETRRLLSQQEQQFAQQLHGMHHDLSQLMVQSASPRETSGEVPAFRDLLHGIEHLERVIESLQVVMTANHALLSDRLYSHQQQPVERAHPAGHLSARLPAESGVE